MHIVGIAVAVVCFVLWMALSKDFKDRTGVVPPSRKQWNAAKRRVRTRGISDEEAMDAWIERKKRRS